MIMTVLVILFFVFKLFAINHTTNVFLCNIFISLLQWYSHPMSQCFLSLSCIMFGDILLNCFAFVVNFQTPNKSVVFKTVS